MLKVWTIRNSKGEINLSTIGATETDAMVKWMTITNLYHYHVGDGDFRIRELFAMHSKKFNVSLAALVLSEPNS